MSPVDEIVQRSTEILRELFLSIQLTAEEKEFVNEAARELAEVSWKRLLDVPVEQRMRLRGIITSVAIAISDGSNGLS